MSLPVNEALFILFVAWVVCYADFKMTKHNFGAWCNGIGAMPDVLDGKAMAPMQYRVLVPWLCKFVSRIGWVEKDGKFPLIQIYLRLKWLSIVATVTLAFIYFNLVGVNPYLSVAVLALYFVLSSLYDYGETYFECSLFLLAFLVFISGPTWGLLALITITALASLTKETAIFIPVIQGLYGEWLFAMVLFVTYVFVRGVLINLYGNKKRYCDIIEKNNWRKYRASLDNGLPAILNGYYMFLAIVVGVAYLFVTQWGLTGPIEQAMLMLFVLSIPITVLSEIRMWAPVALAVVPMGVRFLD